MERWLDCHCIQLPQTADSGSATDHSRVHGGSSLSRRPCRRKLSGSVEHVVVDPGVHPLAKSRPIYLENCLPAAPSNPQFRLRILLARWASAELDVNGTWLVLAFGVREDKVSELLAEIKKRGYSFPNRSPEEQISSSSVPSFWTLR